MKKNVRMEGLMPIFREQLENGKVNLDFSYASDYIIEIVSPEISNISLVLNDNLANSDLTDTQKGWASSVPTFEAEKNIR